MAQASKTALIQENASSATDANAKYQVEAVTAFERATCMKDPFKYWLFENALPIGLCHDILALPIKPSSITETYGKRDSHNDARRFFSPDMQKQFSAMDAMAKLFQSEPVVRAIEKLCDINLRGSFLRVEYCQDREGFWLEPHRDIKEKRITMQIYLNTGFDAATLGTDLYDKNKEFHSRAPSTLGQGMIFIPAEPESWHGFEKRPIQDVRRSLIINYVDDDWRAVHELAYPGKPVV